MAEVFTCKMSQQDHSLHVAKQFTDFFNNEELSDVTLVCDGDKQVKAHKVILAANSHSFHKMFINNPTCTVAFMRGVHEEDMVSLIKFMYSGSVPLNENTVNPTLL